MLSDLNIEWIQMDQEEFATTVLADMAESRAQGLKLLSETAERRMTRSFMLLDSLQVSPGIDLAEYLMGREPRWEDVTEGYAVEREFERDLIRQLETDRPAVCIVTGTAGSGKTTTLMRVALQLRAKGKSVAWVNPEYEGSLRELRRDIFAASVDVVVIDDAEQFGRASGGLLAELASENSNALLMASVRSTRYEDLELGRHLVELGMVQFTVPHLENSDISILLDVLEQAGRLGRLRGLGRSAQERAFREVAGRQLIVAMAEATSGERFDDKLDRECSELGMDLGLVYAVVAVATNFRHQLFMDEILLAIGDSSNEALNRVQSLINQKLVIPTESHGYQVRHRYIADRAVDYFKANNQLGEPMRGLLFAIASKVHSDESRRSREWQLFIRLLNHDVLMRLVQDAARIRECYEEVENLLSWDYHFWLQRGCFEVKSGDLRLAQNFLEQARSLQPNDFLVRTEWSYMMLKRAQESPTELAAPEWAEAAFAELEDAIQERGSTDSYPYHVYGSQGLGWARRSIMADEQRIALLERLRSVMNEAVRRHPSARDLQQLRSDIEAEYLEMSLPAEQRRRYVPDQRVGNTD
jgi:thymidine kinase